MSGNSYSQTYCIGLAVSASGTTPMRNLWDIVNFYYTAYFCNLCAEKHTGHTQLANNNDVGDQWSFKKPLSYKFLGGKLCNELGCPLVYTAVCPSGTTPQEEYMI